MSKTRRVVAAAVTGTSLVIAMAAPAVAEGIIRSSISGAHLGFESRDWTDKNIDAASTSVYVAGCNHQNNDFGIYRNRTGLPDAQVARDDMDCAGNDTISAGDVAAGNYHFTVKSVNGSYDNTFALSAPTVTIRY